jgi:GntR family transcriptional regulator/MocR family aminotransferase
VGTFVSREIPEKALHALQTELEHKSRQARPRMTGRASKIRSHTLVNELAHRIAIDFWIGRPTRARFR